MNITVNPEKKAVVLEIDEGVVDGKRVTSRKRYKTLSNAEPQAMYDVAIAISELMNKDLIRVYKESLDSLVSL